MILRAVLASLPLPMPLIHTPALPLPMPDNFIPALPLPMPLKLAPLLSLPLPLNFAPTAPAHALEPHPCTGPTHTPATWPWTTPAHSPAHENGSSFTTLFRSARAAFIGSITLTSTCPLNSNSGIEMPHSYKRIKVEWKQ